MSHLKEFVGDVEISGQMHSKSAQIDDTGHVPPLGTDVPIGKNYGSGTSGEWCGEPDIWLRIRIGETMYVFPGYLEA